MGLILNAPATTKGGFEVSSGLYFNITEYYVNKNTGQMQLAVNSYKSKDTRTKGKKPIELENVPALLQVAMSNTELTSGDVFKVGYAKLKEHLKEVFSVDATDDI